jgi:hypothetical protein
MSMGRMKPRLESLWVVTGGYRGRRGTCFTTG